MRDEIIEKLVQELLLPLESERQVVYILVQLRKLMDRDEIPESKYVDLRMFCNWSVHSDLSNGTVRKKLQFINDLGWSIADGPLTPEQLAKCSEVLSLESARTDFLSFVRTYKINVRVHHVFQPVWWASLLRLYLRIISDCPLVFQGKDIKLKNIKQATITGCEILDAGTLRDDIECAFEIIWVVEFQDTRKVRIPIPLEFERSTFQFGADVAACLR